MMKRMNHGRKLFCQLMALAGLFAGLMVQVALAEVSGLEPKVGQDVQGEAVFEGRVTFASMHDNQCELELSSGAEVVSVRVAQANKQAVLLLQGGLIRVRGEYEKAGNLRGELIANCLLTTNLGRVEILELPVEKWQAFHLQSVKQAANSLQTQDFGVIHVNGRVKDIYTNGTFLLGDQTGSILARTPQLLPETGDEIEILGLSGLVASNQLGVCGIYHPNLVQLVWKKLPTLTTVEQVRQLKPDQARLGFPVRVRGVITARDMKESDYIAVLQDSTAPIYVWLKSAEGKKIRVGHFCELEGVTEAGGFAPTISERTVADLGLGELPRPLHPSFAELVGGGLDCDWVEIEGVLRPTGPIGLRLLMKNGHVNIRLGDTPNPSCLTNLFNALVKVRGCIFPYRSVTAQVTGSALMLTPSTQFISVEKLAPDLFAMPTSRAADLLRFKTQSASPNWVKLTGQVVHARNGVAFLMDGDTGIRCVLQETEDQALTPGDLIEVAGLSEAGEAAPLLREAVLRKTGRAVLPKPQKVNVEDIFPVHDEGTNVMQVVQKVRDATRAEVEGRLLNARVRGNDVVLEIQSGLRVFEAILPDSGNVPNELPPLGSKLVLNGVVASLKQSVGGDVDGFELLMNSPDDIICLELPPRWTLKEALFLVAGLLIVIVLAFLWIVLLRHRVEQKTDQLRAEMEERRHAEGRVQALEMQTALEKERARIARDIHDELGAHATKISSLADAAADPQAETSGHEQRLADISRTSQQLVRALDETVWTVNPGNDSLADLLDYVTHFAEEFFRDTKIRCQLKIPVDLPDRPMSTELRHGLLSIVKESLNNVLKHSEASAVVVSAQLDGDELQLKMQDDGKGFSVQNSALGNGLNNLRARAVAFDAKIIIQSEPGKGTTVHIKVPLLDASPRL